MESYTEQIRTLAVDLLKSGKVDVVIGYRQGSVPMATVPFMARTPEQAKQLTWDSHCTLNLANYLTNRQEKIGIIAKGCDSRNIVNHIVENKINRDQLHIIGVPCKGMVNPKELQALLDDEIISCSESGTTLTIASSQAEIKIEREDHLRDNCSLCTRRNPVIYDDLVGEVVEEQVLDDSFKDVNAIEAMDADTKWNYFDDLLNGCIRCYACRNACPLCYCPTCFVDESDPQWVGKGQNDTDIKTFHFLRAFHCAGRCTDCGACEAACPMDIHVRAFTRKLIKDSKELFGWEAGLDISKRPPLDTFAPDDPNDFIK